MNAGPVEVLVLHQTGGEACDAGCGPDWSLAEYRKEAAEHLQRRFGTRVALQFLALGEDRAGDKYSSLLTKVLKERVAAPLLVVNGEIRISGYFDIRMMIDMIEAGMEVGQL